MIQLDSNEVKETYIIKNNNQRTRYIHYNANEFSLYWRASLQSIDVVNDTAKHKILHTTIYGKQYWGPNLLMAPYPLKSNPLASVTS